jgi:hypothetical protein
MGTTVRTVSGLNSELIRKEEDLMNNRKLSRILQLTALILILSVAASFSASGKKKLLLFAKNPATWAIVKGGASGKLVYRESSGAFSLSAAGVKPRSFYTLVRYADTPPQVEILATGESGRSGNLELSGVWQNWTKKFWLVPSVDVKAKVGNAGALTAWRPDRYLFEEKPLGVACVCPEPEEP